jgi:arsenical pump membrane protein
VTGVARPAQARSSWVLLGIGGLAAPIAAVLADQRAGAAATQDWPPFVLVTGLLLVGIVARDEGLFSAIGSRLATIAPGARSLFVGGCIAVALVTAVLNLDTAVVFLTPVLLHAARSRGVRTEPLLYGSLLLANSGSLLLPGSNLTNLIVLGHSRLSGTQFAAHMWAPWLISIAICTLVVGVGERRGLRSGERPKGAREPLRMGLGVTAVAASVALVLALRNPALAVLGVGMGSAVLSMVRRRSELREIASALGLPVLVGLFGLAVALGTVGRSWGALSSWSGHAGIWSSAFVAAAGSIVLNNLPAASLFGAHLPAHPLALLAGLDLGPNLLASGSLAWVLWLRAARSAGEHPSMVRASRLGFVATPLALTATVGLLSLH